MPSVRAVVRDAPAAVLMVDLDKRQVVHVNDVAEQLAPGARLPVDLDVWSDAAQLRDLDGAELSETMHPLSRVARAEPVAGQAVSAARRSALGGRREPLWVVALPMRGAPMLDGHALVAFIPLHQAGNVAESAADAAYDAPTSMVDAELRDRAVAATALSFTVADVLSPDQPLVWVNPAFTATTGYELDEVVGRNCRFLQGSDPDPEAGRLMRAAIDQGVSTSVTLVNYRKDGTPFWNQVDLSPVRDAQGRVAHFVGIQTDVTQRVLSDQRTAEALRAEQEARADAEAARARLAFLFEAINRLSATLDEDEFVQRLLTLVVPYLGDWAVLLRTGPQRRLDTVAGLHRDPARQDDLDDYLAALPLALKDGDPVDLLLKGQKVSIIDDLSAPSSHRARAEYLEDLSLIERTQGLGAGVGMVVALTGRSEVRDVLVLVRSTTRESYSDDDVTTALDLGSRAGLVLENVGLYQAQARIAEVLQRSLLPDLPAVTSVQAAARYIANETGAEIGGDFYELLDLGDDGIGIAIGDVTGHDILAAAAMGHLKGLLRASALDAYRAPATVLSKVDHLVLGLGMPTIASAIFAHAVPRDDEWELTWSNAGHLPLLVRRPDGTTELLASTTGANDTLLGIGELPRAEHRVRLPRGSTVIGYTDGLVERRGRSLDEGLDLLLETVRTAPCDLEAMCEDLVERMSAQLGGLLDDDVALLAVHLP